MKKFKLKDLTEKQAIRIAELAFAYSIRKAEVYYDKDDELLYIFESSHFENSITDYIKRNGLSHAKTRCNYCEIDSSFNIEIKDHYTCNLALIYLMLFSIGVVPSFEGTGLFRNTKFVPKNLDEIWNTRETEIDADRFVYVDRNGRIIR